MPFFSFRMECSLQSAAGRWGRGPGRGAKTIFQKGTLIKSIVILTKPISQLAPGAEEKPSFMVLG
jgi:hypothetical protein